MGIDQSSAALNTVVDLPIGESAGKARFDVPRPREPRPLGRRYASTRPLSTREREVLVGLAHGQSAKDVARRHGISVHTVRAQIRSIIRKLGAANIPHAVARAFLSGVLSAGTVFIAEP